MPEGLRSPRGLRYAALILWLAGAVVGAFALRGAARLDSEHPFRNADFPRTYIQQVDVDLSPPHYHVTLHWTGPRAAAQRRGPFRSSPGAGWGTNDCNDPHESRMFGSKCTPKGTHVVAGHVPRFRTAPSSRFVTLFDPQRSIGLHVSPDVPPFPASEGCVRLELYPARLIYDNTIAGRSTVHVHGQWGPPRAAIADPAASSDSP